MGHEAYRLADNNVLDAVDEDAELAYRTVDVEEIASIWYVITESDPPVTNLILRTTQTGSIVTSFATPSFDGRGLGIDAEGCIWHSDLTQDKIYKLNQAGSIITSFATPSDNPRGVGVDSGGCIWLARNYFGITSATISKLNQSGSFITSFAAPSNLAEGLDVDSNDCLWISDYGTDKIYQTNQTVSVVASFAAAGSKPKGVGVEFADGCIWYAETGDDPDTFYKLNRSGAVQTSFEIGAGTNLGAQGLGVEN